MTELTGSVHTSGVRSGELEAVEQLGSITEKTMGSYTQEFCVCLIRGAEDYLNHDYSLTRRLHNVFPVDVPSDEGIEEMEMEPPPQSKASSSTSCSTPSKMPEEKLLPPEDVADADWANAEIPEKDREEILRAVYKEIRREARRAH